MAQAVLGKPAFLLLDEPTSAMSPAETSRCAAILRRWLDEERVESILLVEHDTRFVEALCDRITVLHQGRVLAEGTFDDVRQIQEVQDAYLGRR
jgi:ABC-type branched-subunit amino acid transport system ATPase component